MARHTEPPRPPGIPGGLSGSSGEGDGDVDDDHEDDDNENNDKDDDDDDDDDESQPPMSLQISRSESVTYWKPLGAIAGRSTGHGAGLWTPTDAFSEPS